MGGAHSRHSSSHRANTQGIEVLRELANEDGIINFRLDPNTQTLVPIRPARHAGSGIADVGGDGSAAAHRGNGLETVQPRGSSTGEPPGSSHVTDRAARAPREKDSHRTNQVPQERTTRGFNFAARAQRLFEAEEVHRGEIYAAFVTTVRMLSLTSKCGMTTETLEDHYFNMQYVSPNSSGSSSASSTSGSTSASTSGSTSGSTGSTSSSGSSPQPQQHQAQQHHAQPHHAQPHHAQQHHAQQHHAQQHHAQQHHAQQHHAQQHHAQPHHAQQHQAQQHHAQQHQAQQHHVWQHQAQQLHARRQSQHQQRRQQPSHAARARHNIGADVEDREPRELMNDDSSSEEDVPVRHARRRGSRSIVDAAAGAATAGSAAAAPASREPTQEASQGHHGAHTGPHPSRDHHGSQGHHASSAPRFVTSLIAPRESEWPVLPSLDEYDTLLGTDVPEGSFSSWEKLKEDTIIDEMPLPPGYTLTDVFRVVLDDNAPFALEYRSLQEDTDSTFEPWRPCKKPDGSAMPSSGQRVTQCKMNVRALLATKVCDYTEFNRVLACQLDGQPYIITHYSGQAVGVPSSDRFRVETMILYRYKTPPGGSALPQVIATVYFYVNFVKSVSLMLKSSFRGSARTENINAYKNYLELAGKMLEQSSVTGPRVHSAAARSQ